jgi:hypothetical protein
LIGSLLYIILNTRVNIIYIVIKLACYMSNPNNIYFTAVKKIYKYLKNTKDYDIIYYKNKNYFISGYYNVDYAGNIKITKLTSDYLILYAGGIIS